MNKLGLHPASPAYPVNAQLEVAAPRSASVNTDLEQQRLLVLIPADVDCSSMARQIWELADATGSRVQLLSLCKDAVEEPGLRRRLATLGALIREGGAPAAAKVESAAGWVEVIKRNHQKGDLVVCFEEQRAGLLQRPLSQILQSNLNIQIYILSGANPQNPPKARWLSQLAAWIGSLGIIVASFLLQIRITSLPQDWAQATLLISSVAGEIWLIRVWNNLLG